VLKDVTKTIKNGEDIYAHSVKIRAFGLDWSLTVETSKKDDSDYVGVFLFIGGNFSKE
jgi:hypothetical protein